MFRMRDKSSAFQETEVRKSQNGQRPVEMKGQEGSHLLPGGEDYGKILFKDGYRPGQPDICDPVSDGPRAV